MQEYKFRGLRMGDDDVNVYLLTIEIGNDEFPIQRERIYELIYNKYENLGFTRDGLKLVFGSLYCSERNDDMLTQKDLKKFYASNLIFNTELSDLSLLERFKDSSQNNDESSSTDFDSKKEVISSKSNFFTKAKIDSEEEKKQNCCLVM